MTRWREVPVDPQPEREPPAWAVLAARFDRCGSLVASYVGQRVHDPEAFERIVIEAIERNLDLLVEEHDDLDEFRRLRETADRLIAQIVETPEATASSGS